MGIFGVRWGRLVLERRKFGGGEMVSRLGFITVVFLDFRWGVLVFLGFVFLVYKLEEICVIGMCIGSWYRNINYFLGWER